MNLQWLYYFDTIAELEHYTKAAEKLHVSQSNLSHAIKELENEVDRLRAIIKKYRAAERGRRTDR